MSSTINAQAGSSLQPTALISTADTVANLSLQTNGFTSIFVDGNQNANFISTGAITIPRGNTSQRPPFPTNGMIRYNTDSAHFEGYVNGWVAFT